MVAAVVEVAFVVAAVEAVVVVAIVVVETDDGIGEEEEEEEEGDRGDGECVGEDTDVVLDCAATSASSLQVSLEGILSLLLMKKKM